MGGLVFEGPAGFGGFGYEKADARVRSNSKADNTGRLAAGFNARTEPQIELGWRVGRQLERGRQLPSGGARRFQTAPAPIATLGEWDGGLVSAALGSLGECAHFGQPEDTAQVACRFCAEAAYFAYESLQHFLRKRLLTLCSTLCFAPIGPGQSCKSEWRVASSCRRMWRSVEKHRVWPANR